MLSGCRKISGYISAKALFIFIYCIILIPFSADGFALLPIICFGDIPKYLLNTLEKYNASLYPHAEAICETTQYPSDIAAAA